MKEVLSRKEAEIFSKKLAEKRNEWGLSRAKLAAALSCSKSHLYQIEKNIYVPSVEFVRNTCKTFGLSYIQMTKSDEYIKDLETFGKSVKTMRKAKNISEQDLADVVGENIFVLKEIEAGRWNLSSRQRCALKNFLDIEEEKPLNSRKTKKEEKIENVVLNDSNICEASLAVIGAIVKYISDPEADKKTQKIVFRRLRDIETKILEEKLFT